MGDFTLRNRFSRDAMQIGPRSQFSLGSAAAPAPAASGAPGPVTGSGPGYAAANIGNNRFNNATGKAVLDPNDPDAAGLFARSPHQYEMGAAAPKPPTLQSAPAGVKPAEGMPADANLAMAGNTQVSMSDWFMKQLGDKAGTPWKFMAKGGKITEPIMGFGMNTKTRYMFGEDGDEQVTPMSGTDSASPDQGDEQMAMELQKVLGRNVFIRSKRARGKSGVNGVPESATRNSSLAVNAPVISITEDDVRMLAKRPEYRQLVDRLIEAEHRGGVSVTSRDGSPYAPRGRNEAATRDRDQEVRTPNEQIAFDDEEARIAAEQEPAAETYSSTQNTAQSQLLGPSDGSVYMGGDTGNDDALPQTLESFDPGTVGEPYTPVPTGSTPITAGDTTFSGSDPQQTGSYVNESGYTVTNNAQPIFAPPGSYVPGVIDPSTPDPYAGTYGQSAPVKMPYELGPEAPAAPATNEITWAPGYGPSGAIAPTSSMDAETGGSAPMSYPTAPTDTYMGDGNTIDQGETGGDMFSQTAPPDSETESERMLRLASEAGLTA